jgi:glycosyltransferase involved in cell wall biosynthesis
LRVALVHYWLVTMGGGEQVLEELVRIFPDADIFTHVVRPEALSETLRSRPIYTSFIARLPGAVRHYRKYLPLMPLALEQLDLRHYDLVISSESGPAKGVITGADTVHICYCHTPPRYLWNMYHEYSAAAGPVARVLMPLVFHRLRLWDFAAAARVDHFIANSSTVAARIAKFYRRKAEIIHPPVDCAGFASSAPVERGDFYLCCGRLAPYKRIDLAVEAFNALAKPLVIIGDGEQLTAIRRIAGPTVTVLGLQPVEVLRDHYSRCRALVFPGEEDFGIVPVEAMAAGRPVIGLDRGGLRDTVIDGVTGILFNPQTVEGLTEAVRRFEAHEDQFDPQTIVAYAQRFDRRRFREQFLELVKRRVSLHSTAELSHDLR